MNPRERFLASVRGQAVDRVPLDLAELNDYQTPEQVGRCRDPGRRRLLDAVSGRMAMRWPCETTVNRYLVTPSHRIRQVEQSVGADGTVRTIKRIETPAGPLTAVTERRRGCDTEWQVKYPVESRTDIDCIRSVRWERPPDLRPPVTSARPADFAERCYSFAAISSPMVCVAAMMPFEMFLELCATDLELVLELTEECRRRIADILEVVLAEGTVEYVWMGGCEWLTPPMGSPPLYEKLVQPFEADLIGRCHQAGAVVHVHCHGRVRQTLELVIGRRADYFEPVEPPPDGDITFAEAKAVADGRITLGGNVEARLLERGTPDQVEAATRSAFEGGTRRMALRSSAGPISAVTPAMLANYLRLIEVWEELSPL